MIRSAIRSCIKDFKEAAANPKDDDGPGLLGTMAAGTICAGGTASGGFAVAGTILFALQNPVSFVFALPLAAIFSAGAMITGYESIRQAGRTWGLVRDSRLGAIFSRKARAAKKTAAPQTRQSLPPAPS
ncbi:MAG: hypothetical protein OXT65_08135 [Alphaproteobacteria bacterium]|nr:hypothetical protein [Alphaproteobacteria bacterium]